MPSRARLAVPTALVVCLGLTACGGSSSSSGSGSSTQPGAGRGPGFGFASSPKVAACLKKQGVTLPSGGRRRQGGNGAPPTTTNGVPPTTTNGRPPASGFRGRNPGQFQKLQKALKACGVTFPQGGPGGAPPNGQAPGGQQAPSTSS